MLLKVLLPMASSTKRAGYIRKDRSLDAGSPFRECCLGSSRQPAVAILRRGFDEAIALGENTEGVYNASLRTVGLWRSWERASMAWKRSSVRSRPGPPTFRLVTDTPLFSLVAFGSNTLVPRVTSS